MQTAAPYHVLIVDDNMGIHDDIRALLQPPESSDTLDSLARQVFGDALPERSPGFDAPDYRFESAYQGVGALERVKSAAAEGEHFALAFVDMRMPPGWDGLETIERLWALDPDIHMVICSAFSDYSWEQMVERLGTSNKLLFLRKPFDPVVVKQLALATTSRWREVEAQRQRIEQLESRVEELERLAEGGEGAAPERMALLDELDRDLDELSSTSLSDAQQQILARARSVSASLRSAAGRSS